MRNSHINQFDRFASDYTHLSIIQKEIANEITSRFDFTGKKILDVGCGSGEVMKYCKNYLQFIGIDFSAKMLALHPKDTNIKLIHADFDGDILNNFANNEFDIALSSSALQWSSDVGAVISQIARLSSSSALAIFCAGTFKTIRETAKIDSFLPTEEFVRKELTRAGFLECYINRYKLYFENKLEMFRYIKKSGISGGNNRLSYKQTVALIKNYPLDFLEFEVVCAYR